MRNGLWCPMTKDIHSSNGYMREKCAWWMEDRANDDRYSSCAIKKIAAELMIMDRRG